MDFAEQAKSLIISTLEERGISDRACLVGSGLAMTFLADWRSGKVRNPSFDKVCAIFKYLGLSLDTMSAVEPFEVSDDEKMTEDEMELLRLYRMVDREGKTLVLSAAYTEKRRCAEQGSEPPAAASIV